MLKQVWTLLWWCLETFGARPGCGASVELRAAADTQEPEQPGCEDAGDIYARHALGYSGAPLQTKAPAQ